MAQQMKPRNYHAVCLSILLKACFLLVACWVLFPHFAHIMYRSHQFSAGILKEGKNEYVIPVKRSMKHLRLLIAFPPEQRHGETFGNLDLYFNDKIAAQNHKVTNNYETNWIKNRSSYLLFGQNVYIDELPNLQFSSSSNVFRVVFHLHENAPSNCELWVSHR